MSILDHTVGCSHYKSFINKASTTGVRQRSTWAIKAKRNNPRPASMHGWFAVHYSYLLKIWLDFLDSTRLIVTKFNILF